MTGNFPFSSICYQHHFPEFLFSTGVSAAILGEWAEHVGLLKCHRQRPLTFEGLLLQQKAAVCSGACNFPDKSPVDRWFVQPVHVELEANCTALI